jgi:hypothetical protein
MPSVTYARNREVRSTDATADQERLRPTRSVFGFVSYGWNGYANAAERSRRAGARLRGLLPRRPGAHAPSATAGKRLVDVLDLHWYPEATRRRSAHHRHQHQRGLGDAARVQAPRSLWDPTYRRDELDRERRSATRPIRLIPRAAREDRRALTPARSSRSPSTTTAVAVTSLAPSPGRRARRVRARRGRARRVLWELDSAPSRLHLRRVLDVQGLRRRGRRVRRHFCAGRLLGPRAGQRVRQRRRRALSVSVLVLTP